MLLPKSLEASKTAPSGGPTRIGFGASEGSDYPEGLVVPFRDCDTPRETLTCSPSVFGPRFAFGIFKGDLPDSPRSPPKTHVYLASPVEDFGT